jgi:hypothetical protein
MSLRHTRAVEKKGIMIIMKNIIRNIIILIVWILTIPIGILSKIPMTLVWILINVTRALLVLLRVDQHYYYFSLEESREFLGESLIDMFTS